jgi:hypothetical protein
MATSLGLGTHSSTQGKVSKAATNPGGFAWKGINPNDMVATKKPLGDLCDSALTNLCNLGRFRPARRPPACGDRHL